MIDQEGLWSKKEEFWRNKQKGDFREKCFKRDFLTFFNKNIEMFSKNKSLIKTTSCSCWGSLQVQSNVLILVSSLAIVLAIFLKKRSSKKKSSLASMRTRALPSQLPVGLWQMIWAPRYLTIQLQVFVEAYDFKQVHMDVLLIPV